MNMDGIEIDPEIVKELHNRFTTEINKTITITSNDYDKTTIKMPDTIYCVTNASVPICRNEPIFIHKTNCPNCGGLLDGDEHIPYVRCSCCGAKIWSEREVS